MPTGPFTAANFLVQIDGIGTADFLTVTGLEADVAVVEERTGNSVTANARKLPGESTFTNLVLTRGMTTDLSLWNWMKQTLDGQVSRRGIAVVLLDDSRQPVVRFNFVNAWPRKWSGPKLNSEGSDLATETIEIAYEGLSVSI